MTLAMPPHQHLSRLKHPGLWLMPLLALTACSVNPATGQNQFTGLMSPSQERNVGGEQHPKIVKEYGGELPDPAIRAYVAEIGARLAAGTERPDVRYTFTVLDSDVVNAFALPGGYVYVSRGLMQLANSEAQLAGVIGHEIGHITGRHTAERYSKSVLTQGASVLIGALAGGAAGQLAAQGSQLAVAGWGRGQELEADGLGIRYMTAVGYDPREMAGFLSTMGRHSRLESKLAGNAEAADSFNYLQTHPPTGERVTKAEAAVASAPDRQWTVRQIEYLRRLDGMVYGPSVEQGVVRGQRFLHPKLGIKFEAANGFRLLNTTEQVVGIGPQKDVRFVFDMAREPKAANAEIFLRSFWGSSITLGATQRITVDGMQGATATARLNGQSGSMEARLVAIERGGGEFYRFLFLRPSNSPASLDAAFRDITQSFGRLGAAEAKGIRPYRLRIVTVKPGDTVGGFVARMGFLDNAEERFRVLNDIPPSGGLFPGQLVKLVTQE